MEQELINISGELLLKKLQGGYKIVEVQFDGINFHMLIRQTDKKKISCADTNENDWEYLIFETLCEIGSAGFTLMISLRNISLGGALKRFRENYMDSRRHNRLMKDREKQDNPKS